MCGNTNFKNWRDMNAVEVFEGESPVILGQPHGVPTHIEGLGFRHSGLPSSIGSRHGDNLSCRDRT